MPSTAVSAQGSILQIATGTGGAKTITAAAIGNPTIFTSTAHGLANGDVVAIAALVGTISAMNGLSFNIKNVTANTFAVEYNSLPLAYTSGGTATPTTYTAIGNVKSFSGFDGQASEIDVTNLASVAKEFRLGLTDPGHFQFEYDQDNGDAGQVALRASMVAGTLKSYKLILPSGSLPTASFSAFAKSASSASGVDQVAKGSTQLRISGAIAWS